jgi:hypothetical protein
MKSKKINLDLFKMMSFLVLVLIAFSCAGPQQTAGINDAAAPLDARIIEIKTNLSPKDAYKKTAQVLQDNGFALANTDETLMSITTEPRTFDGLSGRGVEDIKISASIREGEKTKVVLRGTYSFMDSDSDIKKTGQNGSISRKLWIRLHNLATDFGGELSYRK